MKKNDKRPLTLIILSALAAAIVCAVFFSCNKSPKDGKGTGKEDFSDNVSESVANTAGTDKGTDRNDITDSNQSSTTGTQESTDPSYLSFRPVAVVVNNIEQSLPQSGLAEASVIYECTTEGLVTRLLAVFPDLSSLEGIGKIGSVRSARDCFLELSAGHDAIIAHAGASSSAYDMIEKLKLDTLDGVNGLLPPDTFYRDQSRLESMAFEHTMVTSGEKLLAGISYLKFRLETGIKQQEYSKTGELIPDGGAENISFYYSNSNRIDYTYDNSSKRYLRFQYNKKPHIDAESGKQLEFDNVVILSCTHTPANDSENHTNIKLTGTGEGMLFIDGSYEKITWKKESEDSRLVLLHRNGDEVVLKDGKTFFNIVSNEIFSRVKIS